MPAIVHHTASRLADSIIIKGRPALAGQNTDYDLNRFASKAGEECGVVWNLPIGIGMFTAHLKVVIERWDYLPDSRSSWLLLWALSLMVS